MNERTATLQRRQAILLDVRNGLATVEDLAERLGVTPSTIRRDLAVLTQQGQLTRTLGGAAPSPTAAESSLRERSGQASAAKQAIAAWAQKQIHAGETVMLDAGSTAGQLARALRHRTQLTVVTPGVTAMVELVDADGIDLVCLGGQIRHVSLGMVGPLAEAALETLTADRVFLGADGITPDLGICEAAASQTRLKELMMRRSREVYVIADASKIDNRPFNFWARLPTRWTLVTDDTAAPDRLERFAELGVDVIVADNESRSILH